jgi:hypothetical protein
LAFVWASPVLLEEKGQARQKSVTISLVPTPSGGCGHERGFGDFLKKMLMDFLRQEHRFADAKQGRQGKKTQPCARAHTL